ncbi:MAG: hypothetical protein CME70_17025 [Halobacteriovorax sp.]|nr:hypothetical protein [Halobacteriovorax sp.]
MLKTVTLISLLFMTNLSAYEITKEMISFKYQPTELPASKCTHEITNPMSGSWTVKCPFFNTVKEFSVHLRARLYEKNYKPRHRYEVLYWVTNRIEDRPVREFTGTTLWFNFEDKTIPHSVRLGQHVDNSYASLDLKLNLLKK